MSRVRDEFDEALALANGSSRGPAGTAASRHVPPQDDADLPRRGPGRADAESARAAGGSAAAAGGQRPEARHGHGWDAAREAAYRAVRPLPSGHRPLDGALGHTLAEPLAALTDLPAFDTSAMDGWAVSGPGPWHLRQDDGPQGVLAGGEPPAPLSDGVAVAVATGARVPEGTTGVLRSERGTVVAGQLRGANPAPGADIRPRGQECRSGVELVPPGTPVTPAVLGLAAAAGYDQLPVVPRPRVDVLVLGDELLHRGLPSGGRIRDALGPMVGPWLAALGADVAATRRLGDDAEALRDALTASRADLVVTTGGTAWGPVDQVHPTLARIGAELLVSGVAVRPGHPMLLARLPGGPVLAGLPGNPLAAVSGVLTLAAPLLAALCGRPAPVEREAVLGDEVRGHPSDTRLVPVRCPDPGVAEPLSYAGPAMLRGIAAASALAVIPPGGAPVGAPVRLLELPRP